MDAIFPLWSMGQSLIRFAVLPTSSLGTIVYGFKGTANLYMPWVTCLWLTFTIRLRIRNLYFSSLTKGLKNVNCPHAISLMFFTFSLPNDNNWILLTFHFPINKFRWKIHMYIDVFWDVTELLIESCGFLTAHGIMIEWRFASVLFFMLHGLSIDKVSSVDWLVGWLRLTSGV